MASIALVLGVCALLGWWAVRPAGEQSRRVRLSERPAPAHPASARPRFVPVGTVRACTVPGGGLSWSQLRRVRRIVEDHRVRGWEPVHDPRPPLYRSDEWLLTFRKVS